MLLVAVARSSSSGFVDEVAFAPETSFVLGVVGKQTDRELIGQANATRIGRIHRLTHQAQKRGRSLMSVIALLLL